MVGLTSQVTFLFRLRNELKYFMAEQLMRRIIVMLQSSERILTHCASCCFGRKVIQLGWACGIDSPGGKSTDCSNQKVRFLYYQLSTF